MGARVEDIHAARHSSLFGRRTDNRRKQRLGHAYDDDVEDVSEKGEGQRRATTGKGERGCHYATERNLSKEMLSIALLREEVLIW